MMNDDNINGESEEGHELVELVLEEVEEDLTKSYNLAKSRSRGNHLETLIQRRSTVVNIVCNESVEHDIDLTKNGDKNEVFKELSKVELIELGLSVEDIETIEQVKHLKDAFSLQSNKAFVPKLMKVELRLHDFSYFVPGDNSNGMIRTVYNQSCIYSLKKMYKSFRGIAVGEEPLPVPILSNINLVLKPGKMYLVLGPPGCGKTHCLLVIIVSNVNHFYIHMSNLPPGKTTLLRAIANLLYVNENSIESIEGRIEYNGLIRSKVNSSLLDFVNYL